MFNVRLGELKPRMYDHGCQIKAFTVCPYCFQDHYQWWSSSPPAAVTVTCWRMRNLSPCAPRLRSSTTVPAGRKRTRHMPTQVTNPVTPRCPAASPRVSCGAFNYYLRVGRFERTEDSVEVFCESVEGLLFFLLKPPIELEFPIPTFTQIYSRGILISYHPGTKRQRTLSSAVKN